MLTFRLDIDFSIRYRLSVQIFRLDIDILYGHFDWIYTLRQIQTFRIDISIRNRLFDQIQTFRIDVSIRYRLFDQIQTFHIDFSVRYFGIEFSVRYRHSVQTFRLDILVLNFRLDIDISYRRFDQIQTFRLDIDFSHRLFGQ